MTSKRTLPDRSWPALPGREAEVALVEDFLNGSADGGALMLVGEPGIGRTTLLEAVIGVAPLLGYRVIRTESDHQSGDAGRPLSGLRRILKPLADHSGHQEFGDLMQADGLPTVGGTGSIQVAVLVLGLFRAVAVGGPTLIVLDDAHHLTGPASLS